jgi:hypothetical protein
LRGRAPAATLPALTTPRNQGDVPMKTMHSRLGSLLLRVTLAAATALPSMSALAAKPDKAAAKEAAAAAKELVRKDDLGRHLRMAQLLLDGGDNADATRGSSRRPSRGIRPTTRPWKRWRPWTRTCPETCGSRRCGPRSWRRRGTSPRPCWRSRSCASCRTRRSSRTTSRRRSWTSSGWPGICRRQRGKRRTGQRQHGRGARCPAHAARVGARRRGQDVLPGA